VYGTVELVDRALAAARRLDVGLSHKATIQGGSSDFAPFESAGIPFLFFLASDFSRIHTAGDTLDHIDPAVLGTAAAVAIDVLAGLSARVFVEYGWMTAYQLAPSTSDPYLGSR
jgi:Zn-dependent M28 family amino/carboxypeptidase